DRDVAGAAAQVGAEVAGGGVAVEAGPLLLEQGGHPHEDAGGAEAALEGAGGGEGVRQAGPLVVGEALQGGDRRPLHPGEGEVAADDRLAVDEHGATAALA